MISMRIKSINGMIIIFCLLLGYYLINTTTSQQASTPNWLIKSDPEPGAIGASLYPLVRITMADNPDLYKIKIFRIRKGLILAPLMPLKGEQEIQKGVLTFRPQEVLLPDTQYLVQISSKRDPGKSYQYTYSTVEMADKLWLDVKLSKVHTAVLYQGKHPLKWMVASGGRTGCETPLGTFSAGDRGQRFWSAKYGEGALYWVRLQGNYLIHSVPRGEGWKMKVEEHNKLGLPASHGCVRLADTDARFIYENLPPDAMVVIHP